MPQKCPEIFQKVSIYAGFLDMTKGFRIPWSHTQNPIVSPSNFWGIFGAWTKKEDPENSGKPRFLEAIYGLKNSTVLGRLHSKLLLRFKLLWAIVARKFDVLTKKIIIPWSGVQIPPLLPSSWILATKNLKVAAMTHQQTQQSDAPAQDKKPAIITAEMFMAADFEAPIAGTTNVQTFELSSAYYKAANEAKNAGNEAKTAAYVFLGNVMGIMLRATDKATPWGAQWELTNGQHSLLPSDATEQIAELVPLLQHIKNPVLKARVADLIWWNDKTQASAAITAVESYVETVTQILDGKLHG